ncbi:MAG: hypothetical protein A2297_05235 [Elusimicrobia bacterium RIFOXYB2_FULL_48_7]|nr:MAG: hypothetical protein A2297_05235 [Elusimicrobia bacterium RIFOXYB2_FULL_48_7]
MNFTDFIKVFLLTFVPVFVAIDILSTIPIFLGVTKGFEKNRIRNIIVMSISVAFVLGVIFIFVGKVLFKFMGITTADFMIAGGALLFIFSINALVGKTETEQVNASKYFAAVPLATPLIAGPGALTTLIILVDLYGISIVLVSFLANIIIAGILLFYAELLKRIIGETGIEVFSKVSGLFLAAIGVMLFRKGIIEVILQYFPGVR